MKISGPYNKIAIYSIVFFVLTTILSRLFSRFQWIGVYDAVYTAGFPLTFYYTGGFMGIRQLLLLPFLFDFLFSIVIVVLALQFSKKIKRKS